MIMTAIDERIRPAEIGTERRGSVQYADASRLLTTPTRRGDQTLVFGIVSNIKRSFDAARSDAGLSHVHFHDLRHTTGTRLSKGGMSTALVGEILGHSDPKATLRYINRDTETLNRAADILNNRQPVRNVKHGRR